MPNQYLNSKGDFRKIILRNCQQCGAPFSRRPSHLTNGRGRFCSLPCSAQGKWGEVIDRFWASVEKHGPTPIHCPELGSCWVWLAGHDSYGYGVIRAHGKPTVAHRVSWKIHNGPIPNRLCVLHRCDNPPCIRPDHLFLGTMKDNAVDMAQKHRNFNPRTILTEAQVKEIRGRYKKGVTRSDDLGSEYGVTGSAIRAVVTCRNWKHLS